MSIVSRDPNHSGSSTYALAQFLSMTSPDQYTRRVSTSSNQTAPDPASASRLASRLRNKLMPRKQSTHSQSSVTSAATTNTFRPKHIPLPVAYPHSEWRNNGSRVSNLTDREPPSRQPVHRDSGIYSSEDYSDPVQTPFSLTQFPLPPAAAADAAAAASAAAATAAATPTAQKSVNHMQTQTIESSAIVESNDPCCPHCHRPVPLQLVQKRHRRRLSSPAALPTQSKAVASMTTNEAKMLLGMIETLKLQLAEEQRSRRVLEESLKRTHSQSQ